MANRTRKHPTPDTLCCAPNCFGDILELSPIPLCPKHVREAYEFGANLVNARFATVAAEHLAEQRELAALNRPVRKKHQPKEIPRGYVYFIRFSDRIKIGWSADPHTRIAGLPHDEVLAIVPGSVHTEQGFHRQFEHLRCMGEWFRAEPDLIEFIGGLD